MPEENLNILNNILKGNKRELEEYQDRNLVKNFKFFENLLKKLSQDEINNIIIGIEKLIYVEITLEKGKDDPQKIFESLNSTGLDLSEADLIRNYILMDLERNKQEKIYKEIWVPIEKNCRISDENKIITYVSNFIRDYLTLKTGKIPAKPRVFEEFKKFYISKELELFIDGIFKDAKEEVKNYADVFNVTNLKQYHEYLNGGLDNNNNGLPGEYRVDGAYIDMDTIFLQPSLIPMAIDKAMDNLVTALNEGKDRYLAIMEFVALFIKIHPFGDGNGRLSRIILNLAFLYDDVPFYLVLRSNSKDRKKYIEAMREFHSKRKLVKFISVVARTFINQVKEINDSLELAGIEKIEANPLSLERENKILKELENIN